MSTATPTVAAQLGEKIAHKKSLVGVIGLGYVGPPLLDAYIGAGFPTLGFDVDAAKVALHNVTTGLLDVVSVPDVLVWKWKAVTDEAITIARKWQPDVVLSSSPPHSIHHAGRRVAEATGAAWVADFRDPYLIDCRTQPRGLKSLFAWRHQQFERDIYRDAAMCIHAIPLHARWASRHYPFARGRIRTLTNGIPSELLKERMPQPARGAHRLTICAVGVLGRGAVPAIAAVLRYLDQKGVDAEFRHVGPASDTGADIPAELRDRLRLKGPVSHREALAEVAAADVLLKYDDQERAKVNGLSSKLFEYLATGRPIVAVNPTRPDWQLIERLPWCWCVSDDDQTAINDAFYQAATSGARPDAEWFNAFRQRYNRRNQTQQLAQWLDEVLAARPPA